MFNGIITHKGRIISIKKVNNNCLLTISSKMNFNSKEIGSSISCSGVCLTLEGYKKNLAKFYLSKETLKKTLFKKSKKNDFINLEKSLKFGDKISGHFVQGHVDLTATVNKITFVGKSWLISFKIPKAYKKYLVEKGSVTINGVSLTVVKLLKNGFQISIIPHTLKLTNLVNLKVKSIVNVEFDILGKYIKNFIKKK